MSIIIYDFSASLISFLTCSQAQECLMGVDLVGLSPPNQSPICFLTEFRQGANIEFLLI